MRERDYRRNMLRRIKRYEDEAHATITRAFTKVIQRLQRERDAYDIHRRGRQKVKCE
jgi:hypothetical protein